MSAEKGEDDRKKSSCLNNECRPDLQIKKGKEKKLNEKVLGKKIEKEIFGEMKTGREVSWQPGKLAS